MLQLFALSAELMAMSMKCPLKQVSQWIALDQVTDNWLISAKTPSRATSTKTLGTAKPTAIGIGPKTGSKHKPKTLIKMERSDLHRKAG